MSPLDNRSVEWWRRLTSLYETAAVCSDDVKSRIVGELSLEDARLGAELERLLAAPELVERLTADLTLVSSVEPLPSSSSEVTLVRRTAGTDEQSHEADDERVSLRTDSVVVDGKYRLDRLLGRGGMGCVYQATHLWTGRTVAVKLIAPELGSKSEFVERFKREARTAGRLRHPNVVNVTDFGFAGEGNRSSAYLVMEYLDGESLADLLRTNRQPSLEFVCDVVTQVAAALDEAHRSGILHRDLKPDNIWLEPDAKGGFSVKVLDFGIAKLLDAASVSSPLASEGGNNSNSRPTGRSNVQTELNSTGSDFPSDDRSLASDFESTRILETLLDGIDTAADAGHDTPTAHTPVTVEHWRTHVGTILGTPHYMSPEQCSDGMLTPRSDVYSLAVVVYQMLAGEPPFQGTARELFVHHQMTPLPSVREKSTAVTVAVETVINRGLAKDESSRHPTAGSFATALRAAVEGERAVVSNTLAIVHSHRRQLQSATALIHGPVLIGIFGVGLLGALSPSRIVWLSTWLANVMWVAVGATILVTQTVATATISVLVHRLETNPGMPISVGAAVRTTVSRLPALPRALARCVYDLAVGLVTSPGRALSALRGLGMIGAVLGAGGTLRVGLVERARAIADCVPRPLYWSMFRTLCATLFAVVLLQGVVILCAASAGITALTGVTRAAFVGLASIAGLASVMVYAVAVFTRLGTERTSICLLGVRVLGEVLPAGNRSIQLPGSPSRRQHVAVRWAGLTLGGIAFIASGFVGRNLALEASVTAGSTSLVRGLLSIGASPSMSIGHSRSPVLASLEIPDYRARLEILERLLAAGASPDERSEDGRPVLELVRGFDEECNVLLRGGANPDARSADGRSLMHFAIENSDLRAATTLLNAGARLDLRSGDGRTLLMAAQHGPYSTDATRWLLDRGADPNEVVDGATAFSEALANGDFASARLLVERGADSSITRLDPPLEALAAALLDDEARLAAAIPAGYGVVARRAGDETPTPLMAAAFSGSVRSMKWLLANGASVYEFTRSARTPLHYAASGGHIESIRLLVERGIDIDSPTLQGQTPLLLAAVSEHPEAVRFLADRGARLQSSNSTSTLAAVIGGRRSRAENGVECGRDFYETVACLLQLGEDPNSIVVGSSTVLMFVAGLGDREAAQLLLDAGANPHAVDSAGRDAIAHAALRAGNTVADHVGVVRLLLERGADPDHRDAEGHAAWDYATGPAGDEIRALLRSTAAGRLPKD